MNKNIFSVSLVAILVIGGIVASFLFGLFQIRRLHKIQKRQNIIP